MSLVFYCFVVSTERGCYYIQLCILHLHVCFYRLETMQRSLEWAKGRLIHGSTADQMILDVNEYVEEFRHHVSSRQARQGMPNIF